MPSRDKYALRYTPDVVPQPFLSAEEAWFWFVESQEARMDGARFAAGHGLIPRPCEPVDILKVVDQLYRHRRLLRDHLLVLRHYGRRRLPPDERRTKELRAHTLWNQALDRMEEIFLRKGIVKSALDFKKEFSWESGDFAFAGVAAE